MIAIIIVIVAITAGVIGWLIAKSTQAPIQTAQIVAPQKTAPVVQTQPTTQTAPATTQPAQANEAVNLQTYKNTQFGFQLTLPVGWDNYKSFVNNNPTDKNVVAYVYIDLPTSNKNWPGDGNLKGYASMLAVTVRSIDGYNAAVKTCKTQPDPSCPGTNILSTKSSKYMFEITGPQAMPDDLIKGLAATDYIGAVTKSFQLVTQ